MATPSRPLRVWIARPQRLHCDLRGRTLYADATGQTWNPGPARLTEWLYRSGALAPDYCHAVLEGEATPRLFNTAWVHHATHLVSLRAALAADSRRAA